MGYVKSEDCNCGKIPYNLSMWKRIGLCLWLLGIIFPLAWLGSFSPGYRHAFDAVFGPAWMHIVMHAALFGVLAVLLPAVLKRRLTLQTALLILASILVIGLLQEIFQSFSQGKLLWQPGSARPVAFDLVVDLSGGLAGIGVAGLWQRFNTRQAIPMIDRE
jgi:glycopeptide antibiotics resistance protein